MSVAIIGGNERMERRYKDLCEEYSYEAKVFTKPKGIKNKLGNPSLVILFTNTVSHKMIEQTLSAIPSDAAKVIRSHSSSVSSLKKILEEQTNN